MSYEFIKLEKSDRIATLTLNRPAKMNALSTGLLQEFSDALDDVHNDHDINVLILTGEGRAFSAGYDISPGQDAPDIPATAAWDAKHLSSPHADEAVAPPSAHNRRREWLCARRRQCPRNDRRHRYRSRQRHIRRA